MYDMYVNDKLGGLYGNYEWIYRLVPFCVAAFIIIDWSWGNTGVISQFMNGYKTMKSFSVNKYV